MKHHPSQTFKVKHIIYIADSIRSRSLQNRYYNTPLVHWTREWQPQIILLGQHWCEQLAQGRCPTMQRPGSNPRPFDHESDTLTTTPQSHRESGYIYMYLDAVSLSVARSHWSVLSLDALHCVVQKYYINFCPNLTSSTSPIFQRHTQMTRSCERLAQLLLWQPIVLRAGVRSAKTTTAWF